MKVSIADCTGGRVPLLLSRTALARLRADFLSPCRPVGNSEILIPTEELFASLPDHQVASCECTWRIRLVVPPTTPVDEGETDFPKLFHPKKVPPVVQNFLSGSDALPKKIFLSWWKHNKIGRDFSVETRERMIRVHVTPRRTWLDPCDQPERPKEEVDRILGAPLPSRSPVYKLGLLRPSRMIGNRAHHRVNHLRTCGSAATHLYDFRECPASQKLPIRNPMSSMPTSPWKMRKEDLMKTLEDMGILSTPPGRCRNSAS